MLEQRADFRDSCSPLRQAWLRFSQHRAAFVGMWTLLVLVTLAVTASVWLPYSPNALSESRFASPSLGHWLGTDASGRDVLARVCAGTRVSLVVGCAGALLSLVIGVSWGAVAGYAGGRLDALLMRTVDVLYSLPSIVFVIVLVAVMREPVRGWMGAMVGERAEDLTSVLFLVVSLGAVSWLTMARMVRAQVRALRAQAFVDAARSLGAGHIRILLRHLLPGTLGVILAYGTLTIPTVVIGESFLSFLGLGIQPPQASLGSLIADGASQINPLRVRWWLLAGPGITLVTLLLALSFVGDGLRGAMASRGAENRN